MIVKRFGSNLCQWHGPGREELNARRLTGDICPWLYHSLYPYFLGMLYGARFDANEAGDVHVCCPAAHGIDVAVRKRDGDQGFLVNPGTKWVIFAEVTARHGDCPHHHKVGDRLLFPTAKPQEYACPAAFHSIFPLLDLERPACLDATRIRCPDPDNVIEFAKEKP